MKYHKDELRIAELPSHSMASRQTFETTHGPLIEISHGPAMKINDTEYIPATFHDVNTAVCKTSRTKEVRPSDLCKDAPRCPDEPNKEAFIDARWMTGHVGHPPKLFFSRGLRRSLALLSSELHAGDTSLRVLARDVLHAVRARQPRLSACGLFELRMTLLTGLLSLTATYSIVLLQFTHFL
ncbi:hypothetical protein EVAR_66188_1 [Eumeta japonica]|uniref:Uncharacterized protein n=1 Tax=Eumeta variegata TaxID=151549 RepID=A0A4C1ZLL4_EUMVA|nr:hypothetical protein EVAR_66188_1 [Eumeta japonica]